MKNNDYFELLRAAENRLLIAENSDALGMAKEIESRRKEYYEAKTNYEKHLK